MTYKRRIALAVVICAIVGVFLFELHFVDDWVGGVLVWNSEEAYLFSGWSGLGYRFNVIGFLAALVPAYFGASTAPDENRGCTIVFRITPARIERYVVPDVGFKAYIPKGKTIYAWSGGPLWKWAGDHFERATSEEEREVIEIPKATMLSVGKDISDPHGWSVRNTLSGWPAKSEVDIGGKPIFFYVTLGVLNEEISVDVQLPNRERKRILHAKSKFHLVGRREYERAFRDGNPSWTDVK